MNNNILIIEDDSDIRESVRILLESEGFIVNEASNGSEGLAILDTDTDLVILDVMLPGLSGFKVCEQIRTKSFVPILFLTAKSSEADKVVGFNAGGDDYLIKPFSYIELISRIKALIRRHQQYNSIPSSSILSSPQWVEHGSIRICLDKNNVTIEGNEILLTETEYLILLTLASKPKHIFSAQELYENVWNEAFRSDSSNTVMVHIRKLRKKIETDPQNPQIILTVWGKGYRIG
ncbi:MAG: response regulator transcription factor [Pseudobutyrivibrio sp.]|nr:response regulator transcription factor [Pseudobutyrivibrio sp.]